MTGKVEVISYQEGRIDALEEFGEHIVNSKNQVYTKMELLRMLDLKLDAARELKDKFLRFKALKQKFGGLSTHEN